MSIKGHIYNAYNWCNIKNAVEIVIKETNNVWSIEKRNNGWFCWGNLKTAYYQSKDSYKHLNHDEVVLWT